MHMCILMLISTSYHDLFVTVEMDYFLDGLQREIRSVEWLRKNMDGNPTHTLHSEALWAVEEKRNEVEHIPKAPFSVELGVSKEKK